MYSIYMQVLLEYIHVLYAQSLLEYFLWSLLPGRARCQCLYATYLDVPYLSCSLSISMYIIYMAV